MVPYAVSLYRCYERGASVEQLAAETGIPAPRIRQRLRAAAAFIERQQHPRAARLTACCQMGTEPDTLESLRLRFGRVASSAQRPHT